MKKLILLFSVIILLSSIDCGYGQSRRNVRSYWLELGMGCAPQLFEDRKGSSAAVSPFYRFNNNTFTVRLLLNSERFLEAGRHPTESVGEISLLYGKSILWHRLGTTASIY